MSGYLDWDQHDIRDYFSLTPSRHVGCYWRGEPFCPHGLGERSPSQMHETQRHKGCYIKVEDGGKPAQKACVVAWLDGIEWDTMASAVLCVSQQYRDQWDTFALLMKRAPFVWRKTIAGQRNVHRDTVNEHEKLILNRIDEWLHHQLETVLSDAS